jgi:hypothetical protein
MSDLEARQRRLAYNQTLFRSINSNVAELNETYEGFAQDSFFVCECAKTDCVEEIELSRAEYERIRANDRWFFVASSDDDVFPEGDAIVERCRRYYIVEKIEAGAAVAEQYAATPDSTAS